MSQFKTIAKQLGRQQQQASIIPPSSTPPLNSNDESDTSSLRNSGRGVSMNGPNHSDQRQSSAVAQADGYQQVYFFVFGTSVFFMFMYFLSFAVYHTDDDLLCCLYDLL